MAKKHQKAAAAHARASRHKPNLSSSTEQLRVTAVTAVDGFAKMDSVPIRRLFRWWGAYWFVRLNYSKKFRPRKYIQITDAHWHMLRCLATA